MNDINVINDVKMHLNTPMGIHRLMREPYDDREIFESMDALTTYCKTGAFYEGQRVAARIGSRGAAGSYIQNFTLKVDYSKKFAWPIINSNNGFTHIIKSFTGIFPGKYILVYYYNPLGGIMYDNTNITHDYYGDAFKFSVLDLLPAMSEYGATGNVSEYLTNKYLFKYLEYIPSYKYNIPADTSDSYQNLDYPFAAVGAAKDTTNFAFSCAGKDVIPKTAGTKIQQLWVHANRYIEMLGRVR